MAFRIGLTSDFLKPDGSLGFGEIGLELLDRAAGVEWEFMPASSAELTRDQIAPYDGLLVLAPRVTSATLENNDRLAIVARFGVGYDNIDVPACTRHGVILTITPDGVRRPVAVSALTFLLALSHKLLVKDQLTRSGRWGDKLAHMGMGVTGRTLGIIGFGNIGRELSAIAEPLGMRHLAFDPHLAPPQVGSAHVQLTTLETLLRDSDYVCICCALSDETRHLINAERIQMMKPTAYIINVARGPIIDQKALTLALEERRIAGAGLDVFEQEPIDPADPLLRLDNVILAPHAICWTDECFLNNGRSACQSLLDVAGGKVPAQVVNREALNHARWK